MTGLRSLLTAVSAMALAGCHSGPTFPDRPPEYYKYTVVNGLEVVADYPGYNATDHEARMTTGRIELRAEKNDDGSSKVARFNEYRYQLYVDEDLSGDASDSEILDSAAGRLSLPIVFPAREWSIPLEGPVVVHLGFDDGTGNTARMNFSFERVDYKSDLEGVERAPMSEAFDAIQQAEQYDPNGSN